MSNEITLKMDGFKCVIDIDSRRPGLAPNSNRCTIHLTGKNPLPGTIFSISVYCTVYLSNGGQTVAMTSWASTEAQYDVNAPHLDLKREDDAHLLGATVSKVETVVAAVVRGRSDPFAAVVNVT